MSNEAIHIYTLSNWTREDAQMFSDAFKSCEGFRPRGFSTEFAIDYMNNYDKHYDASCARDAAELQAACEQHGMQFKSMSEYYDYEINIWNERALAREAAKKLADAAKRELARIGSPAAAIDEWEHGEDSRR